MMRRLIALAPLVLAPLLLAGGCTTLEPTYTRPAAPVPTAFPQGASYAPAADGTPAPDVAWRDFFRDDRLRQVIDLTLAQNRDLRVAVANIEAARAQAQVQRSELLPTVNAAASATEQRSGGDTRRSFAFQGGFSGWELDLFGRIRSLSHEAQERYLATEDAQRAVRISLIAEAATDYLALAADLDLLRISGETLAAQQTSLQLTQARLQAGIASMLDVQQALTTVQQARADVARYTTAVAQDRNALDLTAGAPVPEALLPQGLPDAAPVMTDLPAGVTSAVLLRRPDVSEAEHELIGANADIGAARAAFFPSISLTATGGASSSALSSLFNAASRAWTFAPAISLPIFSGGRNRANLKVAEAGRDAAVATYEKAIQTAFRDVADALARRGTIGEQLSAETALRDAAAETLTLSTARYQRGSDAYLVVLDAQRSLYAARQTLVSTRLEQLSNAITVYRALGGGVA